MKQLFCKTTLRSCDMLKSTNVVTSNFWTSFCLPCLSSFCSFFFGGGILSKERLHSLQARHISPLILVLGKLLKTTIPLQDLIAVHITLGFLFFPSTINLWCRLEWKQVSSPKHSNDDLWLSMHYNVCCLAPTKTYTGCLILMLQRWNLWCFSCSR